MVLDPIPQPLPVHFFGSRPQPPTSPRQSVNTLAEYLVFTKKKNCEPKRPLSSPDTLAEYLDQHCISALHISTAYFLRHPVPCQSFHLKNRGVLVSQKTALQMEEPHVSVRNTTIFCETNTPPTSRVSNALRETIFFWFT